MCCERVDILEWLLGHLWKRTSNAETLLFNSNESWHVPLWSTTCGKGNVFGSGAILWNYGVRNLFVFSVPKIKNKKYREIIVAFRRNTSVFEEFDSICAVTPWSDWTPCSVTCGKGTRTRSRRYKNHMGRKKCNLDMTQTEMCVISLECPRKENESEVST